MDPRLSAGLSAGTPIPILARFLGPLDYQILSTEALLELDSSDPGLRTELVLRGLVEAEPRLLERAQVGWAAHCSPVEAIARGRNAPGREFWERVALRHEALQTLPVVLLSLSPHPACRPAVAVPFRLELAGKEGVRIHGLPDDARAAEMASRLDDLLSRVLPGRRRGLAVSFETHPMVSTTGNSWELPVVFASWFFLSYGAVPPAALAASGGFTPDGVLAPDSTAALLAKAGAARRIGRTILFAPPSKGAVDVPGLERIAIEGPASRVLPRLLEACLPRLEERGLEDLARVVCESSREYQPPPELEKIRESLAVRLVEAGSGAGAPIARARLWLSVSRIYQLRHQARVDEAERELRDAESLYRALETRHELDGRWRTRFHELRNGSIHLHVDQFDYPAAERAYHEVAAAFEAPGSGFSIEEIARVWGTGAILYLHWSHGDRTKLALAGDLAERSHRHAPLEERHRNLNYVAWWRSLSGEHELAQDLLARNLASLPESGVDFLYSAWMLLADLSRTGTPRALDLARDHWRIHRLEDRLDPRYPYPGHLILLHLSRIEAAHGDPSRAAEGFRLVHGAFRREIPHVDDAIAAVAAMDLALLGQEGWLAEATGLVERTIAAFPRTGGFLAQAAEALRSGETERIRAERDRFPV